MSLATPLTDIEYPESDGKPMGETDVHRGWMIRLYDLLAYRYRGQRVYVGSDLLVYYVEGIPREFLVPDDFVVLDCDPGPRRVFKTWEEGRIPNVVFEVTSRATRRQDLVFKPKTYAQIGVKEMFLYDPTGEYLRPALQGFRFESGGQIPLAPDATGALDCRELGLRLRLEDGQLILSDRDSGQTLMTEAEAERAAREAEHAARQEAEVRAAAAEEELRRLREQIARQQPPK